MGDGEGEGEGAVGVDDVAAVSGLVALVEADATVDEHLGEAGEKGVMTDGAVVAQGHDSDFARAGDERIRGEGGEGVHLSGLASRKMRSQRILPSNRERSLSKEIRTRQGVPTIWSSGTKPQKRESRELSRLSPIMK